MILKFEFCYKIFEHFMYKNRLKINNLFIFINKIILELNGLIRNSLRVIYDG